MDGNDRSHDRPMDKPMSVLGQKAEVALLYIRNEKAKLE